LAGSWAGAAAVVRRAAAESGKVPAVWSKTANKGGGEDDSPRGFNIAVHRM
jgi:hypothetical protein